MLTLSGQILVLQPMVHAQTTLTAKQVCTYLNNEQESQSKYAPTALKGKIFTITEEPLGHNQQGFSYRCARKTVIKYVKSTKTNNASSTPASNKSTSNSTPTSPTVLKKSTPIYVTPAQCEPTTSQDERSIKNHTGGEITICEIVQVYVSSSGTNLLYNYIGQIYRYVAEIGGLIAVLIIIFSGIQIASAGANPDALNKAKARITRSILGLILLFLSAVILYAINPNFFIL